MVDGGQPAHSFNLTQKTTVEKTKINKVPAGVMFNRGLKQFFTIGPETTRYAATRDEAAPDNRNKANNRDRIRC